MIAKVFLITVAILELGAVVGYLAMGRYRLAFIWTCYALATVALVGVRE